jgi:tetratricopeptide (TPR) repeat protein
MHRARIAILVTIVGCLAASCTRDPQARKQKYMASGQAYSAQKKYAEAVIQYRNAIALDARFGDARYKLAAAYEAMGDLRNALLEYVRAADLMPDNVEAQLHAGKLLIWARRYPDAKARALAALAKEPKNINGLIVLGNSLAGLKDIDGAISQIEEAIDAEPRLTFSYANLGLLQIKKGDRSAAEDAFKRATDVAPQSISARLNLANFYWAGGRRDDAERELKTALAIDAKSADVHKVLAALYLELGRRAEAEPHLKAFAEAATVVTAKIGLADYYLGERRIKEALSVLEPLSKDKNGAGYIPASLRLATLDFAAGRHPEAYQRIDEVLKDHPRSDQTLDAKTRFSIAERKFDDAVTLATSVVTRNPTAVTSHYLRGVALAGKGSTDEAIKAFRRVLELAPAATPAHVQLARVYLGRNDTKAAIELLGQAVKAQPRSAMIHLLMGQAQLLAGNLARAEAEIVPLAKANPNSAEAQTWLGRFYGEKRDFPKARQAFTQALRLQPSSFMAFNGLITLDVAENKRDAVRAKLERGLAALPDDRAFLFLAGNTYLLIGDMNKAEPLFKKVLQLDPSNIDAYSRLGSIYLVQRRIEEAQADFEEAARHQAKPVAARTLIGMLLDMQSKPVEAQKQYEQALAMDPQAAVAANNLAVHYTESGGNLDVALQLAQTAKAKLPDNALVSDTLGWIFYKKGLMGTAITALREGAQQSPSNPTIHYHLGLAYLKNGDIREAQQSLQQALKLNPAFKGADDAKQTLATIKG